MRVNNSYNPNILMHFKDTLDRDKAAGIVEEWMTVWHWKELEPKFGDSQGFDGPIDLVTWLYEQSTYRRYQNDLAFDNTEALAQFIVEHDKAYLATPLFADFQKIVSQIDLANYAIYSAQDYLFQTRIPGSASEAFEHVLDFGAGSGRQFCLWSQHPDIKTFISVEALPQTYGMQHTYYASFDVKYRDYILHEIEPGVAFGKINDPILNHIPTWIMQDIPAQSLDMIMTVQVLGELRSELFDWVIKQFVRILRPGGRLYIRDHGFRHCPNKIDIPAALRNAGFILEYEPYLKDFTQIHGIPKMWRKPI